MWSLWTHIFLFSLGLFRQISQEKRTASKCPSLESQKTVFQIEMTRFFFFLFSLHHPHKGIRDLGDKFQPQFRFKIPHAFPHLLKARPKEDFKEWWLSSEIKRWKEYCLIPVTQSPSSVSPILGALVKVKSENRTTLGISSREM